jgi:hypothetical protein
LKNTVPDGVLENTCRTVFLEKKGWVSLEESPRLVPRHPSRRREKGERSKVKETPELNHWKRF